MTPSTVVSPPKALLLAVDFFRGGQLAQAAAACHSVLASDPDNFDALHLAGLVAGSRDELEEAISYLSRALTVNPHSALAHSNLGLTLLRAGRLSPALASYDEALRLAPQFANAGRKRGALLLLLGRCEEALLQLRQFEQAMPLDATLLNDIGLTLSRLGDDEQALSYFSRAVELQPDYAEALRHRGNVFARLLRYDDAIDNYRRALEVEPSDAATLTSRSGIWLALQRYVDAIDDSSLALQIVPTLREPLLNRATALRELGRFEEAVASYDAALRLQPDDAETVLDRLHAAAQCCDWQDYSGQLRRLEAAGTVSGVPDPFALMAFCDSPARLAAAAQTYAQRLDKRPVERFPERRPAARSRIRVAYVSADFQIHATAFLLAGVLERHDRTRFEIFALSLEQSDHSAMRRRLESAVEHFIDVSKLNNRQVAELIRAADIDILVDLKGYTRHARPGLFRYRPAPIAVNYLGFPGTLGSDTVDYILADEWVIPPHQQHHYSERVVYLPDSYQPNDDLRPLPTQQASRGAEGLPESGFVFACFNNSYKITPDMFALWMTILGQAPASVLWLLADTPAAMHNLRATAASLGIDPRRLIFAARKSFPEHISRLPLADLFVDTFPYNAHTTASDALWAGLPLLTLSGESFAARVAGSLLRAVGLSELITTTPGEYKALAVALAEDPTRLVRLRSKLQNDREICALFDTDRTRRNLERAYEQMVARAIRGEAPTGFSVNDRA